MLTRGHWDKLGREVVEVDITVLLVLKCGDSRALEGTLGQSLVSWGSFTWPFYLPGCPCLASQEHLTPYHCLWIIRLFQELIRPMEPAWVLGWPQDVRAMHLTHPCPCLSLGGRQKQTEEAGWRRGRPGGAHLPVRGSSGHRNFWILTWESRIYPLPTFYQNESDPSSLLTPPQVQRA